MARYHFRIRDRYKPILAEEDIEEADVQSACRTVMIALTMFTFSHDFTPEASIELNDRAGSRVALITVKVDED